MIASTRKEKKHDEPSLFLDTAVGAGEKGVHSYRPRPALAGDGIPDAADPVDSVRLRHHHGYQDAQPRRLRSGQERRQPQLSGRLSGFQLFHCGRGGGKLCRSPRSDRPGQGSPGAGDSTAFCAPLCNFSIIP